MDRALDSNLAQFLGDCNQSPNISEIKPPLKKHEVKCELYQKLAVNEKQCSVCNKRFAIKGSLNQHIGQNHKKELLELQKSEVKFTSNETEGIKIMDTMKKDIEKLKDNQDKHNKQQLNWLAKNYEKGEKNQPN